MNLASHSVDPKESVCIVPIGGMVSYPAGPRCVEIDDVQFLAWEHLHRDWAEFGLVRDPVEDLKLNGYHLRLEASDVVGLATLIASPSDAVEQANSRVLRALQLLLSCNSAWGPGGLKPRPVVGLEPGRAFGFTYAQDKNSHTSLKGVSVGPLHEIRLDGFWNANKEAGFFAELNNLIDKRATVTADWTTRLLDSAILLGQSRLAWSPWQAFLLAMIGMERLLKSTTNQSWYEGVGSNVEALFSWLSCGKGSWYVEEIKRLYRLRNSVVHGGPIEAVPRRSAKIADEVLFNLLLVSFKHLDDVKSLAQLVERGRQVKASISKSEKPVALPNATAIHASEYSDD